MPAERRGGFLALRCADAPGLSRALRDRGILTDTRGEVLRLGPAPYVSEGQLLEAGEALREIFKSP
jgi:kynureninase